jgi:hypothetical protein
MISMMKMSEEEIQKAIRFFKILFQINRRINSNFSASQIREVGNKNKNGSETIYRSKTNSRIFGTDN